MMAAAPQMDVLVIMIIVQLLGFPRPLWNTIKKKLAELDLFF